MANMQEKLAESLKELQRLQNSEGVAIVKSSVLSSTHLQWLVQNGFLKTAFTKFLVSLIPAK